MSLLAAVLLAAPGPVLRAGTPVPLVTLEALSSRSAQQGDQVALAVAADVRVGGKLVIPRGAVAAAEVARGQANGAYGRRGRLEIELLHVMVGDRPVRLTGRAAASGRRTPLPAASSAGIVVAALSGAIIRGGEALLPAGSRITGFVGRDVALEAAPSSGNPPPLAPAPARPE